MQLLIVGGIVAAGCYALWRLSSVEDSGPVEVTDAHVKASTRYLGRPYEYARKVDAETTREQMKRARALLVAERERRLAAMTPPATVSRFPRRVS